MHPSLFSFFNRGVASIFALSFGIAAAPNGFCSDVFRGNETFQSFNKAKKILEHQVIFDHRVTLYCNAPFDKDKWISLPPGFTTQVHKKELTESNGNMSYLPKTSDDSSRNGGKVRQCALITEVLLLKEENARKNQTSRSG